MTERTLVLVKPDAVQRGLIGEIIKRFESAGLKIVGMKMKWADRKFAMAHYTEDIAKRRGEKVREQNIEFITSGPVVAICIEGVNAIENVRRLVGVTEPKSAAPGTIRGDYSHMSYAHADKKGVVIKNVIHASSDENDAKHEVALWFTPDELHTYKNVHEAHTF
ncbi:MAG: nucleoside-diphosphate kinase [Nanoarchaeota archaeon]